MTTIEKSINTFFSRFCDVDTISSKDFQITIDSVSI